MLPSTGYFNAINCPFYDNGLCERPYCHFRHVKRDLQNSSSDGIESGAILQKLVSAAVQKVLQQTDSTGSAISVQTVNNNLDDNLVSISKPTYNPTPISELKKINHLETENNDENSEQRKRHIPVPYTPRKPVSASLRIPESQDTSKPFIYIPPPLTYTPGSNENVQCDSYVPPGSSASTETYNPGSEKELQEYQPCELDLNTTNKRNYIPSDRNSSKNKVLEYKPSKVSTRNEPAVKYQPTPKFLAPCFSSDEDEPDNKKIKLSSDLNGLDDLGPEFDILDQILHEENKKEDSKTILNKADKKNISKNNNSSKCNKETKVNKEDKVKSDSKNHNGDSKSKKCSPEKNQTNKTRKHKSHKKEKSLKEKEDQKSPNRKSSKKEGSDKDKYKSKSEKHEKKKEKQNKYESKSSDKSSKQSSHRSSKSDSNNHKYKEKEHRKKKHKSSRDRQKSKSKDPPHTDDVDHQSDTSEMEPDEETIAMECKKIFDEYVPIRKIVAEENEPAIEETQDEEYVPTKKRVSRAVDVKVVTKRQIKPDYKISAAQAMAERLAKVREFHSTKVNNSLQNESKGEDNTNITKRELQKSIFSTVNSSNLKIRIAHVPYASTLINAKRNISTSQDIAKNSLPAGSNSSTTVQTIKKGALRVAHMPSEKFIDRPGVLEPLASKIPANIRSTYLNLMIDECLKLYLSATDAYSRAQHEELATSKKCNTVSIYKNSAVLTVNRLRKELQENNGEKKSSSDSSRKVDAKNTGSWSIENRNKKSDEISKELTGAKFYINIEKWILTEEQLQENGFPRTHISGEKGRASIYVQQKQKQKPPKGSIRTCCRCKKDYTVDKKGFPAVKEECIYHPNNKYRIRGEARYQCCSQDGSSDGCCIAPTHVYEYVDYDNLRGFVKTLPPDNKCEDYGVYALDCEMCYSTHGLDLTRVTIINAECKVVYETLIKPLHPIIDYNTRFSGITEEQMAEVKTTLLDVQATLLTMFNSKTILIGHSLESDFKALKLIHDTVVDTSVLFPHKMGPPYKRALRNLSSEYLKKIIQNSVDGHNSAEDALVCMELIHYKLKEYLKTR